MKLFGRQEVSGKGSDNTNATMAAINARNVAYNNRMSAKYLAQLEAAQAAARANAQGGVNVGATNGNQTVTVGGNQVTIPSGTSINGTTFGQILDPNYQTNLQGMGTIGMDANGNYFNNQTVQTPAVNTISMGDVTASPYTNLTNGNNTVSMGDTGTNGGALGTTVNGYTFGGDSLAVNPPSTGGFNFQQNAVLNAANGYSNGMSGNQEKAFDVISGANKENSAYFPQTLIITAGNSGNLGGISSQLGSALTKALDLGGKGEVGDYAGKNYFPMDNSDRINTGVADPQGLGQTAGQSYNGNVDKLTDQLAANRMASTGTSFDSAFNADGNATLQQKAVANAINPPTVTNANPTQPVTDNAQVPTDNGATTGTYWDKALSQAGYNGNIDLSNRPQVTNPDGSISTVRSKSFEIDGKEVLLPTVSPDGKNLTDQEAIDLYKKTGKSLGIYNSVEEANKVAQAIHEQQAQSIGTPQQTQGTGISNDSDIASALPNSIAYGNANPSQVSSSSSIQASSEGDANNPLSSYWNKENVDKRLQDAGITNPFIRDVTYDRIVAPMQKQARQDQLQQAFKTYLDPKASEEDRAQAKTQMALLLHNPFLWEDREAAQALNDSKMAMYKARQNALNGKSYSGDVLAKAFIGKVGQDGTYQGASDCIGKINDTIRENGYEWTNSRYIPDVIKYANGRGLWDEGSTNYNVGDIVIGDAGTGEKDGHAAMYIGNGKFTYVSGAAGNKIATNGNPFNSVLGVIRTSALGGSRNSSNSRTPRTSKTKTPEDLVQKYLDKFNPSGFSNAFNGEKGLLHDTDYSSDIEDSSDYGKVNSLYEKHFASQLKPLFLAVKMSPTDYNQLQTLRIVYDLVNDKIAHSDVAGGSSGMTPLQLARAVSASYVNYAGHSGDANMISSLTDMLMHDINGQSSNNNNTNTNTDAGSGSNFNQDKADQVARTRSAETKGADPSRGDKASDEQKGIGTNVTVGSDKQYNDEDTYNYGAAPQGVDQSDWDIAQTNAQIIKKQLEEQNKTDRDGYNLSTMWKRLFKPRG